MIYYHFLRSWREMSNKEIIYLFCSDQRGLYKQDALNSISYPNGYVQHFRYDKEWISPGLRDGEINSGVGIIVFVHALQNDEGKKEPRFYPLRRVEFVKTDINGSAVHYYFKLGDFVEYKKNSYQQDVENLENKPEKGDSKLQGVFVAKGKNIDCGYGDKQVLWENLIKKLEKISSFENTIFYRLKGVRGKKGFLKIELLSQKLSGYILESGRNYWMDLSFYREKYPTDQIKRSSIEVITNNSYFQNPLPSIIPTCFRIDKKEVYLVTKRIYEKDNSEIIIKKKDAEAEGEAPYLRLLVKLTFNRWLVILGILVFALGALCVGLDDLKFIGIDNKNIVVGIKFLGAILMSGVLFCFKREIK